MSSTVLSADDPLAPRTSSAVRYLDESRYSPSALVAVEGVALLPSPSTDTLGQVVARVLPEEESPLGAFEAFVEANGTPRDLRRRFYLRSDRGIAVSETDRLADCARPFVASNLTMQVGMYNARQTSSCCEPLTTSGNCAEALDDDESCAATPDCVLMHIPTHIPTHTRTHRDMHTQRRLRCRPAAVVEVLQAQGGVRMVRDLAHFYLSPSSHVQVFVGIKVMHPVSRQAPDRFRACAFVFRRDHAQGVSLSPVDIVSFGTLDLTQEQRAHIAEVMGTPLLRGCSPSPQCSAAHDYFVDVPWEVFEAEQDHDNDNENDNKNENARIPWVDAEDPHLLRLSLFCIQKAVINGIRRMIRDTPLLPNDNDHDHLRCNA